jgi:hypothetical protein
MAKISIDELLNKIYGIICDGYRNVFQKLEDLGAEYTIKSEKSDKPANSEIGTFYVTKDKNTIHSRGIYFGTMHENKFFWNDKTSGILKDIFVEFMGEHNVNKKIVDILIESLFSWHMNESINDESIEIIPYIISMMYNDKTSNVVKFATGPDAKDTHYFLLLDFPLKLTKNDLQVTENIMESILAIDPKTIKK